MTAPLIVGVDGSDSSLAAVGWAGREAAATGRHVQLMHVRPQVSERHAVQWARANDLELEAVHALTKLAGKLREDHPGLRVGTEVVSGPTDLMLLRAAERNGTLVLGTRGSGGFGALMLGSVAQSVAARTENPLILVPLRAAAATPGYRVVVGVDPDVDCGPVLDFALELGQEHGAVVQAVYAWQPPVLWAARPVRAGTVEREHGRTLNSVVAAAHARVPRAEVVSGEFRGAPAVVLLEESEKASLLVVGRRRHRPVSALGPVIHAVVHHATCPVAVVPHW